MVWFSVVASDPDGDGLTYYWMEGDSELGTGSPYTTQSLKRGTHTITLVVTDGIESVEKDLEVVIVEDDRIDDEEGGIPMIIWVMVMLGIVTGALTLYVFMMGRKGPDMPIM